jgi:HAD superfamily hydrolase (TIGR01509 family)
MTRFTPPVRPYSAYIFDCDGTLIDTMPLHHQAWKEALWNAGARFDFTWDVFVRRAGMTIEQTVRELSKQFDVALDPIQVTAAQRAAYTRLEPQIQPIAEVVAFADDLKRDGRPLAVASGSNRESVERALRAVGIWDWFKTVVTPEAVERGKPHPDMFLLAAARLGARPSDCLVIEDGEMGFEAARRAQMDFAVVADPRQTP